MKNFNKTFSFSIGLNKGLLLIILYWLIVVVCPLQVAAQKLKYPIARKDKVIDDYHSTKVSDPYRWLEDPDSPETLAWVEAQNKLTFAYLESIPAREKIKSRLTELWNYPWYSIPWKKGNQYFYLKNDGLQNQDVLYMQKTLDSDPQLVIDPNTFSKDGTVAITNVAFSKDGTLMAYAVSSSGSDWQKIKIRDVDCGKDYNEVIKWCKFSAVAWKHDNSGFFYNRYPEPGTVREEGNTVNRVYYHELGTIQSEDRLVYEHLDADAKDFICLPYITDDGKYLYLSIQQGTDPKNRIYYREIKSDGPFIRLLHKADAKYTLIDNIDTVFYFQTDLDAPQGRIIAIDINKPTPKNWEEIVPEQDDVIGLVAMVNNQFVIAYMHDVHHKLKLYNLNGTFVQEVKLPTIGSIDQYFVYRYSWPHISGNREDSEMFVGFESFLYPTTILHYNFKTDKLSLFRKSEINFNPSGYETNQIFYSSKDGTHVPMFIIHKRGLKFDGSNPILLGGYGGFNISLMPFFSNSIPVWLENGGVFVIANIRGGGEYGEGWHQSGMLDKKQNVFDDFIAAAEWLIKNEYTNPSKLAIRGGSNGGLLVAACMVQRPELFGAVVCQVPVIDMLRYHNFTVGRYWVPEYGNAETNLEHFKFLYAYSPLHNVQEGVIYPPTLITAADTDDRVVPAHAKKFAATLQLADAGKNPILLRVETKAGHGGGKPTSKVIEELSDIYAFLFNIFGINTFTAK